MNDLKIYAQNQEALDKVLKIVDKGSKAVGMALWRQKCGVAHMEKGKIQELGTSELTGTGAIKEVTVHNMHRYLGVDQVFWPNRSGIRQKLKTGSWSD